MKVNNKPPALFDLFTGNKTPELAIFYNLAHDNIKKFILSIDTHLQDKKLSNIIPLISNEAAARLREYIWKGGMFNKNDDGHPVTENNITLVKELLRKLNGLRNFQSHYWHNNDVLKLSDQLKHFIDDQHNIAFAKLTAKSSKNTRIYDAQRKEYPFYKPAGADNFLTLEGRLFFLSFFLTKGEMELLLSQTKGSKLNSTPEYKLKREVYTFFCHREGSSWENIGVKNEELQEINVAEQQRILKGRQASKLLHYLNDVPANDELNTPLLFKDGEKVLFADTIDNLLRFININRLFKKLEFKKLISKVDSNSNNNRKAQNDEAKLKEQKKREGYTGFIYDNRPHTFEISFKTLLQITTDCLQGKTMSYKNADGSITLHSAEEHFYKVLDDCIKIREHFYNGLKKYGDEPLKADSILLKKIFVSVFVDYTNLTDSTESVYYTTDQLRNLPLLTTPKAEKKLIEWHDALLRGKASETAKRKGLLNLIRPANTPFDKSLYEGKLKNGKLKLMPPSTEPENMIFHLALYYKEQAQKNRSADRFTEWAAKYIYDFNLAPGWHWEMEKLVYEKKPGKINSEEKLKKQLLYKKELTENYRVKITDNAVVLAYPKKEGASHSREFYKLRLEERALKTLLALHFSSPQADKTIADFLNTVKDDYLQLLKADAISLTLLEEFAIPPFLLKNQAPANEKSLKKHLQDYMQAKIVWADEAIKQKNKLNRNEKNKIILDAYKVFDFSKTEGKKFLRKNEYQQMSVVHFMLMQNKHTAEELFSHFKLNKRLPDVILDLLNAATDMNELFDMVLDKVKKYLQKILTGINEFKDNDKALLLFTQSFNIEPPASLLSPSEKAGKAAKKEEHKEDIPFIIHPMLAIKYYYPDEFMAGGFNPNDKTKRHRNIFKELRSNANTAMLVADYYDTTVSEKQMPDALIQQLTADKQQALKLLKKKASGEKTDNLTKDILLTSIADRYLADYDATLHQQYKQLTATQPVKAHELFATPLLMPLQKNSINFSKERYYTPQDVAVMPDTIYLQLLMHQVDDYFFRSQQDRLYRLALHFINRRAEELELYKDHTAITDKIKEWPDGSREKPVKLGDLINERKICAGLGRDLLQHIMDYEATVINSYCNNELKIDSTTQNTDAIKAAKQQLLEAKIKKGDSKFIAFWRIKDFDNSKTDNAVSLLVEVLRNQCQHSSIPLTGTYRQLAMPGSKIAELLHIYTRLGKDRTAPNIYEQDEKNDLP